jgi:5'-nucleotidase
LVRRARLGAVLAVAVAGSGLLGVPPVAEAALPSVPVQILAINDLHGRISLTSGEESRLVTGPGPDGTYGKDAEGQSDDEITTVGGAANLATVMEKRRADFRDAAGGSAASFLVSAGDMFGASPPVSADYRDEPAIEVANALGVDVSAVGDDEFSRGTEELLRISAATDGQFSDDVTACQGVSAGVDGCFGQEQHAFTGANYTYLAANVVSRRTGRPILPPYQVLYTPTGFKVAFIGVVTPKAPDLVAPQDLDDVQFTDEAQAINRYVPELQDQGIQAIAVLTHDGGGVPGPGGLDPNGCDGLSGPIVDLNNRIDPAVDLIVSGLTHAAYNCLLPAPGGEPRLVTQAGAHGQLVTDIRLTIDRGTGEIDRTATYGATNVPVTREAPDERVQAIVDYWSAGPGSPLGPGTDGVAGEAPTTVADTADTGTTTRSVIAVGILVLIAVGLGAWLRFHIVSQRRLQGRPGRSNARG